LLLLSMNMKMQKKKLKTYMERYVLCKCKWSWICKKSCNWNIHFFILWNFVMTGLTLESRDEDCRWNEVQFCDTCRDGWRIVMESECLEYHEVDELGIL
jgi:hypothetical protein